MAVRFLGTVTLAVVVSYAQSQSSSAGSNFNAFEVATIKPTPQDRQGGAFYRMQSAHQFEVRNYSLRALIGAAYNLTPRMISGGPSWIASDHFDILAATPGNRKPTQNQQMIMLQALLRDRFKLGFHREKKELSVYVLKVAKSGPKIKESKLPSDEQHPLVFTLFPNHASLPARNATMMEFASVLQRGSLSRPVLDETMLSGRYDFELNWSPDESQFGGRGLPSPPDPNTPDLFTALKEQLGLVLESKMAPVEVFIIDHAEKPGDN